MTTYELMIVFKADVPVDDEKALRASVEKIAKGLTVESVTLLGKRTLAYPIKHLTEGIYVLAIVKGETANVSAIEREVQLGNTVLRFLLTIKKEVKGKKARRLAEGKK